VTQSSAIDPAPATTSDRIRQTTLPYHKRAEHADFQQRLVSGKHGPVQYGAWLGQMLLIHRALEQLEDGGVRGEGAMSWPIERSHFKTAELEADLATVGADPAAVTALPATHAFIAQCRAWAADPAQAWRLLGAWYVLEGATNGGRYIARNVRRGAGIEGAAGTRYLDPYGETQPQRWQEFKDALNASVPAAMVPRVVEAACDTYDAVTAMGAELSAQFPG
jgi:heme oxygenase